MHYMILLWNTERNEWEIKHYSHNYYDMQRMKEKYPPERGFVHMVDVAYARSDRFFEEMEAQR